ncbi:hypothetical protein [Streptomyces sp.]|uniref:hypothetical protein n=1 Tax=Streptomyces sp. TaxID=1931 RepID=UPI002F944F01
MLTNTSHPMENEGVGADGLVEAVVLQIPRTVLPLRSDRADRLLGQRIPASRGTAAILADFFGTLLSYGPRCGGEEINRLGPVTLDLATAGLAQQLGALDEASAEARAQVMRQRINAFIKHNPGDPELTPQRSLSPFLVVTSPGLGEEALAGEAAVGDVHVWVVGGQAE